MWTTAFQSIKREIISLAAVITVPNTKITTIKDPQITFFILFVEHAVLNKNKRMSLQAVNWPISQRCSNNNSSYFVVCFYAGVI